MNNEKIELNMTMEEMLMVMSEGNVRALNVLMNMILKDFHNIGIIFALDSMDIRGEQIWRLYKDCSGENLDKFSRTIDVLRLAKRFLIKKAQLESNDDNEYNNLVKRINDVFDDEKYI